jgi:hypothetical protein
MSISETLRLSSARRESGVSDEFQVSDPPEPLIVAWLRKTILRRKVIGSGLIRKPTLSYPP